MSPIPLPPIRDAEKSESDIRLPPGVLVSFVDVTGKSGIRFQHFNGRTDMDYIMETMGSGLGWLDYDQDGLMDLFLVQSATFVPPHAPAPPTCKLFKNLGNGTFRDVTEEVALLAAVQQAERDIDDGRVVSNEEMKSRIAQWSAK